MQHKFTTRHLNALKNKLIHSNHTFIPAEPSCQTMQCSHRFVAFTLSEHSATVERKSSTLKGRDTKQNQNQNLVQCYCSQLGLSENKQKLVWDYFLCRSSCQCVIYSFFDFIEERELNKETLNWF